MVPLAPLHPVLGNAQAASRVLDLWRAQGPEAARCLVEQNLCSTAVLQRDRLQRELKARLAGDPGPRLLVDGVWFGRPRGGITRVWEQILATWLLPGLANDAAPIALIDRESHLALTARFVNLEAAALDPLDCSAVAASAAGNAALVQRWNADVFVSSWISASAPQQPACAELALVHDCLPERYQAPDDLQVLRRRWLQGARGHLAVSADTAADLETLLRLRPGQISWCHPAPPRQFSDHLDTTAAARRWNKLAETAGLVQPYVLLPASSAIGSYKNPEAVAEALAAPELARVQLVLCGIAAEQRAQEMEQRFGHLRGRCKACGFSDWELALAYRQAFAVVLPSHAEGFGLPAIEAMACAATVLVADSRGLREAGGGAALRFNPRQPQQLAQLLVMLQSGQSDWLRKIVVRRQRERLQLLQADLMGLSLLAVARALWSSSKK